MLPTKQRLKVPLSELGKLLAERRKELGLSRPALARQLGITAQTVLNFETGPDHNIGTSLLRRLEPVLHVAFNVEIEKENIMGAKISMGNDLFILYIRQTHPECKMPNDYLGKQIWKWLKPNANATQKHDGKSLPCLWPKGESLSSTGLPSTATQFEFDRAYLPELFSFLDLLAQQDADKPGSSQED